PTLRASDLLARRPEDLSERFVSVRPLALQSLTRVHPPSQCLDEAVISLFAFCLRSCERGIRHRRIGRQPKSDKQCQCFIPDFNMPVQSLKLADNPINAPAERCLHTLRSVW